ncbi:hypothetical protein [Peribacillus sp. RS7]|uniref:hypothetical protein n=1 Tax=Peribacillus sp. RS7 TaxID=3242679 RepID=UPI0035C152B1
MVICGKVRGDLIKDFVQKRGFTMGKRKLSITVFLLSLFSLLISLKLFWNLGIFVDEYGLSPDIVNGGDLWLTMDWLRLLLLLLLCVVSGISIFRVKQNK